MTVRGNLHMEETSRINGIDIVALNNSVMTAQGEQTITGVMVSDLLFS